MPHTSKALNSEWFNKTFRSLQQTWSRSSADDHAWPNFVSKILQIGAGGWAAEISEHHERLTASLHERVGDGTSYSNDNLAFAKRVFGIGNTVQLSPGIIHPKYPEYWDDYLWLEASLARRLRANQDIDVYETRPNEVMFPTNRSTSILAIGGPVCHEISQLALEYDFEPVSNFYTLKRRANPLFGLRFEYVLNDKALLESGKAHERIINNKSYAIPNWGILDNSTNEIFYPEFTDGEISSDFLLVTVLPNFFNRSAYEADEKIIVAGGTHIIGTSAMDLVFKDEAIRSVLSEKVRGKKYWQSLVRVNAVNRSANSAWHASSVNIHAIQTSEVQFTQNRLEDVMLRIASTAGNVETTTIRRDQGSGSTGRSESEPLRNLIGIREVSFIVGKSREAQADHVVNLSGSPSNNEVRIANDPRVRLGEHRDQSETRSDQMTFSRPKSIFEYKDKELVSLSFETEQAWKQALSYKSQSRDIREIPDELPDRRAMIIPKWSEALHVNVFEKHNLSVRVDDLINMDEITAEELSELRWNSRRGR